MYKYTLNDNEDIIKIFDNLYIKQGNNEKITSAILTNQRLLFLDYIVQNEGLEVLRIARGSQAIQYKEVYYQIMLNDKSQVPLLKKVVVASGNKVAIGNNIENGAIGIIRED